MKAILRRDNNVLAFVAALLAFVVGAVMCLGSSSVAFAEIASANAASINTSVDADRDVSAEFADDCNPEANAAPGKESDTDSSDVCNPDANAIVGENADAEPASAAGIGASVAANKDVGIDGQIPTTPQKDLPQKTVESKSTGAIVPQSEWIDLPNGGAEAKVDGGTLTIRPKAGENGEFRDTVYQNVVNLGLADPDSITKIVIEPGVTVRADDGGEAHSVLKKFKNLTQVEGLTDEFMTHASYKGLFAEDMSLSTVDLTGLNCAGQEELQVMFTDCTSLTSLDLSSWDTSSVTTLHGMFYNCTSLTSVNLSGWDTRNVTLMQQMFRDCSSLTTLDLSSFDTSSCTSSSLMFRGCTSLENITLSSNFNFVGSNTSYLPEARDGYCWAAVGSGTAAAPAGPRFDDSAALATYQNALTSGTETYVQVPVAEEPSEPVKKDPIVDVLIDPITYGTPLSGAKLSCTATSEGVDVPGTIAWENPATLPQVSDSNSTMYNLVFTPDDTTLYNTMVLHAPLTVKKAMPIVVSASSEGSGTVLSDITVTGSFKGVFDEDLAGTLSWDDPLDTELVDRQAYSATFIPDNPNYQPVTVSLQAERVLEGEQNPPLSLSSEKVEGSVTTPVSTAGKLATPKSVTPATGDTLLIQAVTLLLIILFVSGSLIYQAQRRKEN